MFDYLDKFKQIDDSLGHAARPCQVDNHVVQLSASLGITVWPDDGENSATLISRADKAMYVPD